MFQVDLKFEDICIESINKDDLVGVYNWVKDNNVYKDGRENLDFKDFCDRFLEYYLGEGEVFLKITRNNHIIGLFKGAIEFKDYNEFWIRYFGLKDNVNTEYIKNSLLKKIIKIFREFNIGKFYVIISSDEKDELNFWNKNGFLLVKICDDIVNVKEKDKTFILLKEEIKSKN
ncbi:GNAT family N-acetyltransferase [Haloimpatiens lingqiaonensis]|uniref:GNAT family N-acetyltransferase n=1 Tax=Haloimpatiens lingqiaonensis TaxID=1380675 RepID=UPI0010FD4409|nr:GNAT family N-acetyltransferase [Haloimpatiens lingqiaonensis]